ncbi:MAG TPA: hypothetical protein VKL40_13975, partial [Candidatus Angelobacter sp.]|nr:hypothetical protein [Candidatus Angelobacter sp.]
MKKRFFSPRLQVMACCVLVVILACLALTTSAFAGGPAPAQSAPSGPKIWLQDSRPLPVTYTGAAAARASGVLEGIASPQPVAMASADVDGDGIADLVVGYSTGFIAVHRGNLDAFAPQSDASFQAIGRNEFPSPFLPEVQTFAVSVSPDFIAAGDFTGLGHLDLAVAARGGSTIYIFAGDGKGNFTASQTINLPGGVTSLAAGALGRSGSTLIIGVANKQQSFLAVYGSGPQGLAPFAAFPLSAPASNILFGEFGDNGDGAAFLSGGKVQILRPTSPLQLVSVSLPVSATAIALGRFVYDRNPGVQIALLASDGSIQIAARNEFDPRVYTAQEFSAIRQARRNNQPVPFAPARSFPANGWKIVESLPSVGSVALGQTPVFFQTRISNNGADDVVWLNASGTQMVVVSHPDLEPGATTFLAGQLSVKPYNGSPVSALPMRINIDGRPGVMAIHQGQMAPAMSMPLPDPTFFPNRFDDIVPRGTGVTCLNTTGVDGSMDCTLREAIIKANATVGTDTIMLQAGTYTLSQPRAVTPLYDATTGTLNVTDSLNIIGAGQNTTIIQAGTVGFNPGPANGVDMLMAVNEDLPGFTNATASISNLTLQNGHNRGKVATTDGDAGCLEFDTGGTGNNTLTLTNVTIQNCDTTDGNGGGIAGFNSNNGTGLVTISNSIIQGNKAVQGGGTGTAGGVWVADPSRMSLTSVQVLNNQAPNTNNTNQAGSGGGITITSNSANSRQTVIHNSTISGNQAAGEGGGIKTSANLLVDQGTVINNNSAGSANVANKVDGGGIFMNVSANGCPGACTDSVTLNKITITGNSAPHGHGGGISTATASGGGPLIIGFSRLAGNSAGTSGSNLENFNSTVTATTSANPNSGPNWWGTDAAGSTIHTAAGTTLFDPFIVLTHTGNLQKIRINQSSTLTGDMSKDNHGNAVGLANLVRIIGLPITFDGAVLGSIPQAQPETLNASAQATATFNAGGTSGLGTANATVDQAVVPVNSNLISSATEVSTTATITTVGAHGFSTGEFVSISGVTGAGTCAGYNGSFFKILSTPTVTTFTYTAPGSLSSCGGGTANAGIIILEPPSITKSFGPTTVAINAPSTITFSITNNNVVPINASFVDNLPANLVVATTPNVVNNCTGGTVTAAAG